MPYSDIQLASAFIQTGELEDALDALNRHLSANPLDDEGLRLRAEINMRSTDRDSLDAALADLGAITVNTSDDALNRATILLHLDHPEDALDTLSHAIAQFPDNARIVERMLTLFLDMDDLGKARALVAEQSQDDWRWRSWAGELAAADRDVSAAIAHFSAAIDQLRRQHNLRHDGPAQLGDMMQMTVIGTFARLHLNRGSVYVAMEDWQAAADDFELAARLLPGDPTITLKRGIIAWLTQDQHTALQLCQAAFASASDNVYTMLITLLDDYPDLRAHLSL